ncbi:MAG: Spy/CpxP family protein refolding chaperone [Alphaproteobacteria bacterium]|nr:Spy/CpxP family protein refolding chaperone [Alphaproteobacteria bacterium]
MTPIRRTLIAIGFMSLGAVGAVGLQAAAGAPSDAPADNGGRGFERGPGQRGDHMHGHRGQGGDHGLRAFGHAMSQLDLTEAQQDALAQVREDVRARMLEGRMGNETDREAILTAMADGSLDRDSLHETVDQKAAEMIEIGHYTVDKLMDVYETLDDDQRTELAEVLAQAAERRRSFEEREASQGERPDGAEGEDRDFDGRDFDGRGFEGDRGRRRH